MISNRSYRHRRRSASIIIEVVLAAALLATAGVALAKLKRSSAALARQSDQRLVATLAAENVLYRLGPLSIAELKKRAERIGSDVARHCGCQIDIALLPIDQAEITGIHLVIVASVSKDARVVRHDWRLLDRQGQTDSDADANRPPGESEDAS